MRLIPLQSSSLAGIAHRPGSTTFYVQFVNGSVYEYDGNQETSYILDDVLFAETSQGKAFNECVKDAGLLFRKLTDDEVSDLDLHV